MDEEEYERAETAVEVVPGVTALSMGGMDVSGVETLESGNGTAQSVDWTALLYDQMARHPGGPVITTEERFKFHLTPTFHNLIHHTKYKFRFDYHYDWCGQRVFTDEPKRKKRDWSRQ